MLRLHDPINRYLVATGAGIGWVLALGRMFYYNPMTYDKTTWWGMWSYNFIKPWMVKFPSDGPLMKLKDLLPEPQLKPGEKRRIAKDTDTFHRVWRSCKGSGRFYRKGRASKRQGCEQAHYYRACWRWNSWADQLQWKAVRDANQLAAVAWSWVRYVG